MALFGNIQQELQNWLSHITQKYNPPKEVGVDIGLPQDTPVYAITGGQVIGSGYYAGGGVESIQSNLNYGPIQGPASVYYQHLDVNLLQKGQLVLPGQLIGYSGGQLSGGSHPSTRQFSSGPHIEVGINAPFSSQGIWANRGPNVNPLGFLQSLAGGTGSAVSIPVISGVGDAINNIKDIPSGLGALASQIQQFPQNVVNSIGQNIKQQTGISSVPDFLWRVGLTLLGVGIIFFAILAFVFDMLDKSNVEVAGTRV